MKVETPQILWNAEQGGGDNGSKTAINAALYSVSMVQSGIVDPTLAAASSNNNNNNNNNHHGYGNVLATAGNSPLVNLWKVSFPPLAAAASSSSSSPTCRKDGSSALMYQRHERGNSNSNNNKSPPKTSGNNSINNHSNNDTKIDYLCTLARHDGAVNCLAFSPDGLHLATAGDKSSSVIVWSVPVSKRGNNNGRHHWSSVTRESDLCLRILSCNCDGVVDISWSADSKRFLIGTIDSAVLVVEDTKYAANHPGSSSSTNNTGTPSNNRAPQQQQQQLDSSWKVVYRSKEHTHFVQGVSYDPLGVYLASMSNDRSVRIYPRKTPGGAKSKKKLLRPSIGTGAKNKNNNSSAAVPISALPPADHARMVANLLTDSKLEFGKSKQIKQRKILTDATTGTIVKQNLFADESTLESFFRRLSWTTDGAFLVTPAVLWHSSSPVSTATTTSTSTSPPTAAGGNSGSGAPSYATCLYARHHFDQPYKVFSGLEKPSLVVRPNPVLFQLPETAVVEVATKENANAASSLSPKNTPASSTSRTSSPPAASLPYKSIFCVLTNDSVLIYDTHHDVPLSVVRGLHYSNLADATWSQDGHSLIVCSTDGYLSILRFAPGELGKVYTPPPPPPPPAMDTVVTTATTTAVSNTMTVAALGVLTNGGNIVSTANSNSSRNTVPPTMMVRRKPKKSMALAATSNNIKPLPPCEPGSEAILEEPPMKRSKTFHDATAQPASSYSCASTNKRPASVALGEEGQDDDHDETVKAVDKLSLGNDNANNNKTNPVVMAKKKKRVQPILLSSA